MSSDRQPQPSPPAADTNTLSLMNLTLLDPPKWGWTAAGIIADVLPPHERARRKRARTSYAVDKRLRERDPSGIQRGVNSTDAINGQFITPAFVSERSLPEDRDSVVVSASAPNKTIPVESNIGADSVAREPGSNEQTTINSSVVPTQDWMRTTNDSLEGKLNDCDQAETQQICNSKGIPNTAERSERNMSNEQASPMVHPCALNESGVLDMFTYHRGREGREPRDGTTGELLCDVEPTDTNHGFSEPKLKFPVSIEFPLQDAEEYAREIESTDHSSQDALAHYKDSIEWDLSNSAFPSPMEYALRVAEDFGLSFGQTVDVAVSIQNQIDDYLRSHIAYGTPITIRDPSGLERESRKPAAFSLQLYGSVTGEHRRNGFPISKKAKAFHRSVYNSKASSGKPKSVPDDDAGSGRAEVTRTTATNYSYDSSDVEEGYIAEVQKRAKAESEEFVRQLAARVGNDGNDCGTFLKILDTGNCHICHKRSSNVAQFPCLIPSHIYCRQHCKSKLGIVITNGEEPMSHAMEYCPICSLVCNCNKCFRQLHFSAVELKSKHASQGLAVEDIVLGTTAGDARTSIRTRSQQIEPRLPRKIKRPANGQGRDDPASRAAPKIPASDFPREVCAGIDIDPGTPSDYLTIYTADGSLLQSRDVEPAVESIVVHGTQPEPSGVDDGNVDYCQLCGSPGSLLCCDVCPRAYHPECLKTGVEVQNPWECPTCSDEKGDSVDDVINGRTSLEQVCAGFVNSTGIVGYENALQLLSIIHEMLNKLIEYDFGETFGEPVDLMIIGYKEMIKNPMDLGTVRDNIVNGTYARLLADGKGWDDIVLAALQDIELVWHNCFIFNREGSAIYRMAEVLRRRSLKIRQVSFENLLTARVKTDLERYIVQCNAERGNGVPHRVQVRQGSNARYKITVKRPKGGISRPVAILDPDRGIIVKIYSTMKAAGIAASFLSRILGHACEWKSLNDLVVKSIIHRSMSDPSVRLFGYRWLLLDDLRVKKVQFPEKVPKILVEMIDETGSYLFQSVEDALCYGGLPKNVSIDSLRKDLMQLDPGIDYTSLAGKSFRILTKESSNAHAVEETGPADADIALISGCRASVPWDDQQPYQVTDNVVVVKEDIVAHRTLAGFDSARNAYLDWVQTFDSSPANMFNEQMTEEHFLEFYLDGDRNVDGIVWRSVKQTDRRNNVEKRPPQSVEYNPECLPGDGEPPSETRLAENELLCQDTTNTIQTNDSTGLAESTMTLPPGAEDENRSMNGFETNLHFLADVTELGGAFSTPLSIVDAVDSLPNEAAGKLGTFASFAPELLQTCQSVQLARPSDNPDVQTIIKTVGQ